MKLTVDLRVHQGWVSASVEDEEGTVLGQSTAPVVPGATFNFTKAAYREATEEAAGKLITDLDALRVEAVVGRETL